MFKINDKVVCVDGEPRNHSRNSLPDGMPVEGQVYVVCGRSPVGGIQIISRRVFDKVTGIELGFQSRRFRLVSEVQAENRLKRTQKKPA